MGMRTYFLSVVTEIETATEKHCFEYNVMQACLSAGQYHFGRIYVHMNKYSHYHVDRLLSSLFASVASVLKFFWNSKSRKSLGTMALILNK